MQPVFGCRRFRWLASEREDRDLTSQELKFFNSHRESCQECAVYAEQSHDVLDLLRGAAIHEVESTPMFEQRVIRRFRAQKVRESLRYWSPALTGAVIACVAIFATLSMVSRPDKLKSANLPTSSASRFHEKNMTPCLELDELPRFTR